MLPSDGCARRRIARGASGRVDFEGISGESTWPRRRLFDAAKRQSRLKSEKCRTSELPAACSLGYLLAQRELVPRASYSWVAAMDDQTGEDASVAELS